jgi:hypothetical protein
MTSINKEESSSLMSLEIEAMKFFFGETCTDIFMNELLDEFRVA